jgi:uncharacterized membrane protein SpoIIM required for sporulation
MTPLRFEELYDAEWSELEALLDRYHGRSPRSVTSAFASVTTNTSREPVSGARLAELYRRACEHLALAQARAYPAYMLDRLERITADAHQLIYQDRELGIARLRSLATRDFPRAVRRHARYVSVAALAFMVPTIAIGLLVYWRTDLILSVVDSSTASSFDEMYSPNADSIGRLRTASTDWAMFGYYIRNNIGVAFQCFAGGLFGGVGSLLFLAFNGAFGGAIAGYLVGRGLSHTFFPFVATHSAFELTAIILAGAAGLRIGHALLAPGRLTRSQALVAASRETVTLLYGVTAMLCIAAVIEAFWSSASWLPAAAKYTTAAICWSAVIAYLTLQGRRAG